MNLHHETIVLERAFPASPSRLFRAFADPRERELWSAPSEDVEIRIDACDFRTGGAETARCGPRGDLKWALRTTYHLIEPDRLIACTEDVREGEHMLTVALITFEITPESNGARLRVTDQVASFVGADGVDGHRQGYAKALDNLTELLVSA